VRVADLGPNAVVVCTAVLISCEVPGTDKIHIYSVRFMAQIYPTVGARTRIDSRNTRDSGCSSLKQKSKFRAILLFAVRQVLAS
jgi:hypothetical protein